MKVFASTITPILLVLFGWVSQSIALEKISHEVINQNIARRTINEFSLDFFLKNSRKFKAGVGEPLSGYSGKARKQIRQEIWQWLGEGGWDEDEPDGLAVTIGGSGRSNNHFHNPLQADWEEAGLNDYVGPFRYYGQSSAIWAQNSEQDVGGQWSWEDARGYYYKALTAGSRQEREAAFADTFRGLGQICHLIQDASIPAHVRNSIHIGFNYEKWVESIQKHEDAAVRDKFSQFIADPIGFDPALLSAPFQLGIPIPISKIIDADKYNGTNPNITTLAPGSRIGLTGIAEYTNANFFSEKTIFSSVFPYPKLSNAVIQTKEYIPDPRNPSEEVAIAYYQKTGDGDTGYRLAVVSFLENFKDELAPGYGETELYSLDGRVYEDYARKLLPRAAGYSAGLLKYFFRGNLQVTAVPIFYRGYLHFLKLKIKNLTANEAMKNGDFTLHYRYTPVGGNNDGSNDIFGQALAMTGSFFVPCVRLDSGIEMAADFRIYPPIAKKDYVDIQFDLVFKGVLGDEGGAVIGKTFKPGYVVFEEEWDKPLPGNYEWAHTAFNYSSLNPANGETVNSIAGDFLLKENRRFEGYRLARVNESFLGHEIDGHFKGPFPIRITPETYLVYEIDEMSISPPGAGYQFMLLSFTNKLAVQISQLGQTFVWNDKTVYRSFTPGQITIENLYNLFLEAGIPMPDPFEMVYLGLDQHLYELESPAAESHVQRMKVDFIQIVEGNMQ
jgi:hypothetical protein